MELIEESGHSRDNNNFPQQVINLEKREKIKILSQKMMQLKPTSGFTEDDFRKQQEHV